MTERFAQLRLRRVVLWPIAALIAVVVLAMLPPRVNAGTAMTAAAYVFYLTFLLAALVACRAAGIAPREIVGPPPSGSRPWITTTILTPLLLTFSAVGLVLTLGAGEKLLPGLTPDDLGGGAVRPDFLARLGETHRVLLALNITLLGPFAEEFVFRGLLLRRWLATRGLWPALLGSSAIFALLHPPSWIGSFTFGVVMGVLYLWSGSLLLPVLAHVLNNALVTMVLVAAESAPSGRKENERALDSGAEWAVLLIALVVVGSLIASLLLPMIRQVRERHAG